MNKKAIDELHKRFGWNKLGAGADLLKLIPLEMNLTFPEVFGKLSNHRLNAGIPGEIRKQGINTVGVYLKACGYDGAKKVLLEALNE